MLIILLIILTIFLDTFEPKWFLYFWLSTLKLFILSKNLSSELGSISLFQPVSTVSTHSVSGLNVMHGVLRIYASFCIPPESVMTLEQFDSKLMKSKYPRGFIEIKLFGRVILL